MLTAGTLPAAAAERQKKRPGRFRVGPVYLTPKLALRNAGVDTNVFNQRTGEISDTTVVLSPILEGALPVGRRLPWRLGSSCGTCLRTVDGSDL